MSRNLKYLFVILLLSVYASKKEHPKPTPPIAAIQDPLLSKLTLTTSDKTWENEHLSFSVYAMPQTFINNPLTITTQGATKTYTYQYNQYGYPTSAAVSDNTSIKYEYVAKK